MDRILRLVKLTSYVMLILLLIGSSPLLAQSKKTVTGVVKSGSETLPGVTVMEKGTNNGTVTDVDGKFTLPVNESATLVFSFVGMKTQEVSVGAQTSFDIAFEADVTTLNDVVVIGYGEVERRDLTSSVSSVNSKQLADVPLNNAGTALAGRLAGVQVTTSEGTPNATVQIRVRGGGSITQDNSPLFIVDGIQVENALSVISPQDIASIDVLKDASATAIYGSRGANGVVIITTKRGRNQKTTVSYNGLVGFRTLANKLQVMKPYDFVMYQYERSRGNSTLENNFRNSYGNFSDLELYKSVPFTDWQEESFGRNALMQTHNIAVNGGTATTSYNLSATSNTEEGIQLGSDFDRKLVTLGVDQKINKFIKAGVTFRYNNTVVNGAGTASAGSSSTNRLRQSVKYKPILFPGQDVDTYDPNYAAETNSNSLALVNPILLAKAEYQKDKSTTVNIGGYIAIDPTPYLSFRTSLGYDIFNQRLNIYNDTITNTAKLNGQGLGIGSIDSVKRTILNNSNVLTFSLHKLNEAFGKNNKLDFMVGQEVLEKKTTGTYNESHLFPKGTIPDEAFAGMRTGTLGTPFINPGKAPKTDLTERLLSFFSRASYSYKDKYMGVFTMRADGSSKFAEGHQWGYFPSASLAWRVFNERFFDQVGSKLKMSDFKVRLSFGQSGNNRMSDFLYLSQFETYPPYFINNAQQIGFAPKRDPLTNQPVLANQNLKWETTISRNLGFDLSFLENRISLSVDVYSNTTQDLLINAPVGSSSGYTAQQQNIGSTSNKGVEIQLSGTAIQKTNFTWKANFNMSFNKNNVEALGRVSSFLFNSGWNNNSPADYSVAVGQPTGTIWGLVTDGYYRLEDFDYNAGVYTLKAGIPNDQIITGVAPRPGILKFKDLNGDNVVNDNDRTGLGSALPTFFGGLNQQFTYKNWDMSVFINFQYGNKVLNANKLEFSSGYTTNSNLLATMNDRWRNVNSEGVVVTDPAGLAALNPNPTLWSPLQGASSFFVHSWAVEDGSFIRINNVTLGYTLPQKVLEKIKISRLRLYATVNNLWVFTNYSGYDPDVNTRRSSPITPGVDYSAYPRSHAYIFGVNMTF